MLGLPPGSLHVCALRSFWKAVRGLVPRVTSRFVGRVPTRPEPENAGAGGALDPEEGVRALIDAGDVDGVEAMLSREQTRDRETRGRRGAREDFALLVASGQRREAVKLARMSRDDGLRDGMRDVEARRISGNLVRVLVGGEEVALLLGEQIIIGRAPSLEEGEENCGTLAVVAPALSRRHVAIARRHGEPVVRDLGSYNGTLLRGQQLTGDTPVGEGIDLELGAAIPLRVRPLGRLPGTVTVEIAGCSYAAPLGPAASVGIGRWRLEASADGWVELVTDEEPTAFQGSLQLVRRITLVAGDSFGVERGGRPHLVVARARPDIGC
jgi:hypothetical protein